MTVGSIKLTKESSISVFITQRYYFFLFLPPPPFFGCPATIARQTYDKPRQKYALSVSELQRGGG